LTAYIRNRGTEVDPSINDNRKGLVLQTSTFAVFAMEKGRAVPILLLKGKQYELDVVALR
jgi:hypothetical protein